MKLMISVNDALEKIINDSPFLEDGLYNEYINLSSLANYIKPKVEIITKKEITIGAIKMALSRYVKDKKKNIKYQRFSLENFFIKKGICIIYTKNLGENLSLLNKINLEKGDYLSITHGSKNSTIIFSENLKTEILKIISQENIEMKINNLGIVGIFLEQNSVNEIGVIYTLAKKINFSNINLVEIISNYLEIHLIVQEDDLRKTINSLIS